MILVRSIAQIAQWQLSSPKTHQTAQARAALGALNLAAGRLAASLASGAAAAAAYVAAAYVVAAAV